MGEYPEACEQKYICYLSSDMFQFLCACLVLFNNDTTLKQSVFKCYVNVKPFKCKQKTKPFKQACLVEHTASLDLMSSYINSKN